MSAKKVVMSGMRPTGRLHLGNYWGALKNYVTLQDQYECFFAVADWHMLTTGYEDTGDLQDNVREMVLDWLAAGVDPDRAVVFKQSEVPEHAELALLLSMITPLSWLENNPTWKEQLQELAKTKESVMREHVAVLQKSGQDVGGAIISSGMHNQPAQSPVESIVDQSLRTHGHIGYPVLQAADILLYGGEFVPVGKDQVPHLELSRDIARRFNSVYGKGKPVLSEPQPLLTPTPRVPGLDGRKMSKSYNNAINLLETEESLKAKLISAYTDPKKIRANDPGHPNPGPDNPPGCTIFALHQLYSDYWQRRETECKEGKIGCVQCKKDLLESMKPAFADFAKKRAELAGRKGYIDDVLAQGRAKAKKVAERTMSEVRKAMRLA